MTNTLASNVGKNMPFPRSNSSTSTYLPKNMNNSHLRNLLSTCRQSNKSFTEYCDIHQIKDKIPKHGLSVLHVNIKSLIKNMSKSEDLILGMSLSPDLIAISETWLTNSKTVNVNVPILTFF